MTAPQPTNWGALCGSCGHERGEHTGHCEKGMGAGRPCGCASFAPQPTPDSRVDSERLARLVHKIGDYGDDTFVGYEGDEIEGMIVGFEAAGLLVLDPDDEATVDRIANAYGAHFEMTTDPRFCHCGQQIPGGEAEHVAQQILAALRGSR